MLQRLFLDFGGWAWLILGLILLALEILVPGAFLLWVGVAALATGVLSLVLEDMAIWTWQIQVLVFLALSLVCVVAGSRIMAGRERNTDEPLLNQRAQQMIGRSAVLTEPIHEGYGRVRMGDTFWNVKGSDASAGMRIRVVGVDDGYLVVEQF